MKKLLGFLTTLLVACGIASAAGDTPIQNLRLVGSANGAGFSFTNLNNIVLTGNVTFVSGSATSTLTELMVATLAGTAPTGSLQIVYAKTPTNDTPPNQIATVEYVLNHMGSATNALYANVAGLASNSLALGGIPASAYPTNGQANFNFGTNLTVNGVPVLTNAPMADLTQWATYSAVTNVIPASSNIFTIGSTLFPFKSGYFGTNGIFLDDYNVTKAKALEWDEASAGSVAYAGSMAGRVTAAEAKLRVPYTILHTDTAPGSLGTAILAMNDKDVMEVNSTAVYDPILIPAGKELVIRAAMNTMVYMTGTNVITLTNGVRDTLIAGFAITNPASADGNGRGAGINLAHYAVVTNVTFYNVSVSDTKNGSGVLLSYHQSVGGDNYATPNTLAECSTDVNFINCSFYRANKDVIEGGALAMRGVLGAYVANCQFVEDTTVVRQLSFQNCVGAYVEENMVSMATTGTPGQGCEGIKFDELGTCTYRTTGYVLNNVVRNGVEGIDVDDKVDAFVFDNVCLNQVEEGISVDGTGGSVATAVLERNLCYNSRYNASSAGIRVESGSTVAMFQNVCMNNSTNYRVENGYSLPVGNSTNIADVVLRDTAQTIAYGGAMTNVANVRDAIDSLYGMASGSTPTNWSSYPATQDVDLNTNNLHNCAGIGGLFGGALTFAPSGDMTVYNPIVLDAFSGASIDMNGHAITDGDYWGNGFNLTNLNASALLSGTVPLTSLFGITSNQMAAATDAAYRNMTGTTTNGQANVNFGTNLMVNGNPVLTNSAPETDTLLTVLNRGYVGTGKTIQDLMAVWGDTTTSSGLLLTGGGPQAPRIRLDPYMNPGMGHLRGDSEVSGNPDFLAWGFGSPADGNLLLGTNFNLNGFTVSNGVGRFTSLYSGGNPVLTNAPPEADTLATVMVRGNTAPTNINFTGVSSKLQTNGFTVVDLAARKLYGTNTVTPLYDWSLGRFYYVNPFGAESGNVALDIAYSRLNTGIKTVLDWSGGYLYAYSDESLAMNWFNRELWGNWTVYSNLTVRGTNTAGYFAGNGGGLTNVTADYATDAGSAGYASTAGYADVAAFATNSQNATNAYQLGGIAASEYMTNDVDTLQSVLNRGKTATIGSYMATFLNTNTAVENAAEFVRSGTDYLTLWGVNGGLYISAGTPKTVTLYGMSEAGKFVNGSYSADLGRATDAGHFTDGTRVADFANGTYAVVLTGTGVVNTLLPAASNAYDLGSALMPFRSGYFGTNSVYLGDYNVSKAKAQGWDAKVGTNDVKYVAAVTNGQSGVRFGTATLGGVSGVVGTPMWVWTQRSSTSSNWVGVAVSPDGIKMVATPSSGYVYASTDSGITWSAKTNSTSQSWKTDATCVSSDGMKMIAMSGQMYNVPHVYRTADSGATWSSNTPALYTRADKYIRASTDGVYVVVLSDIPAGGGVTFSSSDSGANWTQTAGGIGGGFGTDVGGLALASDGLKTAVATFPNEYIYTSTNSRPDGGGNWVQCSGSGARNWKALACSYDGVKLFAGDATPGYIYTSSDFGVNWTTQSNSGSRVWSSISASSDGQVLVASVNPGYVYVSTDGGVNWAEQTSAGSNAWNSVDISADGTEIIADANPGHIWTALADYPISNVTFAGSIVPTVSNKFDVGSASLPAKNGYFNGLYVQGNPVLTNVAYVGQAGTSAYANVAGYASVANLASNALQLNGIAASAYVTNGQPSVSLGTGVFSTVNASSMGVYVSVTSTPPHEVVVAGGTSDTNVLGTYRYAQNGNYSNSAGWWIVDGDMGGQAIHDNTNAPTKSFLRAGYGVATRGVFNTYGASIGVTGLVTVTPVFNTLVVTGVCNPDITGTYGYAPSGGNPWTNSSGAYFNYGGFNPYGWGIVKGASAYTNANGHDVVTTFFGWEDTGAGATGTVVVAIGPVATQETTGVVTMVDGKYLASVTQNQANVNFGTNLMVNGNPVLTNAPTADLSQWAMSSAVTNVTPAVSNAYDIGSSIRPFRDEYLARWMYWHGDAITDDSWRQGYDPVTSNVVIQVRMSGVWTNSVMFIRPTP